MKPTKYNPVVRSQLIELSSQGLTQARIAYLMNISIRTLQVWLKKYPELKEDMKRAKIDTAKDCIEVGLRKLAAGTKDKTITKEFITTKVMTIKEQDDEGNIREVEKVIPVNKKIVEKHNSPDSKAIEILARKYSKEFDTKHKEETTINILDGFTMRELQESRKNNVIDGELVQPKQLESLEEDTVSD